jgi:ABC-type multidrug transport system fused ATPase/permease subunit
MNLLSQYGLDAYFLKFDRGWQTLLGENGCHLSGGELQILGLARALLQEPDVLIIDEGLNALDSEMEKTVLQMIHRYAMTHLVLISTHNLAMITGMDYVYVLKSGGILQSGTPAELLEQEGYFKSAWRKWCDNIYQIRERLNV